MKSVNRKWRQYIKEFLVSSTEVIADIKVTHPKLKRRENGRDVIGVMISVGTIKKVVTAVKSLLAGVKKMPMNLVSNIPVSRRSDPISSHLAEHEINSTGVRATQQLIILAALEQHPGKTSLELSTLCPLDRYQVARRLSDLRSSGHAVDGFLRQCTVGKRMAREWWTAAQWHRMTE